MDPAVSLIADAESQDDCAVFRVSEPLDIVASSDYVRGSKFRLHELGLLDEYDLGYYLASANFSDIAAMGARPIGLLSVVRYPKSMSDDAFEMVLSGIRDSCALAGAPNVGGDIGSAERLILSATALGVCAQGRALMRSGACEGDVIYVTGATGIAGAALQYFSAKKIDTTIEEKHRSELLRSWKRPTARVRHGLLLGRFGHVTSCIDTSDGLKAAIETIANRSGCGARILENVVPVRSEVAAVARHLQWDSLDIVFGDSVDFQLVFTAPATCDLLHAFEGFEEKPISLGVVTREPGVWLEKRDGSLAPLPGQPWRHHI
ncbi:MAG: thiamine-phosphate kinase [Pseudonocardiaceae bacterium]